MPDPSAGTITRSPRWPWVVLCLGLVWTVVIRIPLILNAEDHLDSDLAVDGLTLIDALRGQWRWHYPGTPHMGILPLLFSYLQAFVWGANAVTLVSGGTLIWLLIVAATFWLAWKTYDPSVAGWAILPLIFSSTGTIWLSGRITGGHLLTLAWHTLAFVGLHACSSKGGASRAAALGLWCGLGLYLDMMFLFTLFGLIPAAILASFAGGKWRLNVGTIAAFFVAVIVGFLPHEIGRIVDPYDAYPSQFVATVDKPALAEHGRLLTMRCLPRLVAGIELERFDQLGRRGEGIVGKPIGTLLDAGTFSELPPIREWLAGAVVIWFLVAIVRLLLHPIWSRDARSMAIGLGTTFSALLIVGAFLVNRNIFNSDNYRYLIYVLTPWSIGFGLLINDLMRRGKSGRAAAILAMVALGIGMTARSLKWYQNKLHYMSDQWQVVTIPRESWPETRRWRTDGHIFHRAPDSEGLLHMYPYSQHFLTYTVPSDVTHLFGDYWDVYRMSFLSGKRVTGVPHPIYPNRFPGWSRGLGPGKGRLLVLGLRSPPGREPSFKSALDVVILELYEPKTLINWRAPFATVWQKDGRDPAELNQIRFVVPSFD
jgi:hypothetical protein